VEKYYIIKKIKFSEIKRAEGNCVWGMKIQKISTAEDKKAV